MDNEAVQFIIDNNFAKQYSILIQKYKNKKILIYGAGKLFQAIRKHYNLSEFNIVGISDINFREEDKEKEFFGYKKILLSDITNINFDAIFVALLRYEIGRAHV